MTAEGDVFNLSQVINASGLAGSAVTASVRWGDGSETPATVSALPATGPLSVSIDYSLDSGFFNDPARRNLLQIAADSIVSRFNDDLLGILASGVNTWSATFSNPTTNAPETRVNLPVAANEIIIFAGARDLPGNTRGFGGPGGFSSFGTTEWNQLVQSRGEPGALLSPQTDFAPWGGSITFDNADTNWYFDANISGIQSNQIDFLTVATHELAHALGFGFIPAQANRSSWDNLSQSGNFVGPNATTAFGSSSVPLEAGDRGHWREGITSNGRDVLMDPTILSGARTLLTPLDFAAFDDIGWDVDVTNVTVTASHTYADNGSRVAEIVLRGTNGEFLTTTNVNITNALPTLTVPTNQALTVGQTLSLPNIGQISDPGFANTSVTPPTAETFTFEINWGDQTPIDTGTATIDRVGSVGQPTLASFDGTHLYANPGTYTVTVRAIDDDNGAAQQTFTVVVDASPTLSLSLDRTTIAEDAGVDAATLTISRSGSAMTVNQTITLASDDTTEATIPASVVILAGQTSVTAIINAIDDTLLDGEQTVLISATAPNTDPDSVELKVTDRESITALFNGAAVREDAVTGSLVLTVRRSNTDTGSDLNVNVTGGAASQLVIVSPVVIPSGQATTTVNLTPVNDTTPELLATLQYTFTAAGYTSGSATIGIIDDEPPKFQRQSNPFDVNGLSGVTASDALEIIRELNLRGDNPLLNPATEEPNGVFVDVSGDYRVTALDALEIINELNRTQPQTAGGEIIAFTSAKSQHPPLETNSVTSAVPQAVKAYDHALNELQFPWVKTTITLDSVANDKDHENEPDEANATKPLFRLLSDDLND
jgi:Dockerin type I domain